IVANLLTFGTIDKCLLETLYDPFHVLKERFFRAVVIDEVLDNVARKFVNTSVDGVSFVDDFPLKNDFTLFIHLVNLAFAIFIPLSSYRILFGVKQSILPSEVDTRRLTRSEPSLPAKGHFFGLRIVRLPFRYRIVNAISAF